jgi:hypothetical protein
MPRHQAPIMFPIQKAVMTLYGFHALLHTQFSYSRN